MPATAGHRSARSPWPRGAGTQGGSGSPSVAAGTSRIVGAEPGKERAGQKKPVAPPLRRCAAGGPIDMLWISRLGGSSRQMVRMRPRPLKRSQVTTTTMPRTTGAVRASPAHREVRFRSAGAMRTPKGRQWSEPLESFRPSARLHDAGGRWRRSAGSRGGVPRAEDRLRRPGPHQRRFVTGSPS